MVRRTQPFPHRFGRFEAVVVVRHSLRDAPSAQVNARSSAYARTDGTLRLR